MICRLFGGRVILSALLGALTVGCGGDAKEEVVRAKGRVTAAGEPLHVEGREIGVGAVEIKFYKIGPGGRRSTEPEIAQADADGHFEVMGPDGNGIPPGKYRIAIRQWDPYPQVDKLDGKFDEQHSPITREITGKEEIVIDLLSPEG